MELAWLALGGSLSLHIGGKKTLFKDLYKCINQLCIRVFLSHSYFKFRVVFDVLESSENWVSDCIFVDADKTIVYILMQVCT